MKTKFLILVLIFPIMAVCQKKTVNLYSECYKIESGALVQVGCDTAFRLNKFFVSSSTFSYTTTIDTVLKSGTIFYIRNRSTGDTTTITPPLPPDWWKLRDVDTTLYDVGDTLIVGNKVDSIVYLFAQGREAWEIGKQMKMTTTAVNVHIINLRAQYGAANVTHLVYIMTKKGLL